MSRIPTPAAEAERMAELARSGLTYQEIALAAGRSYTAVKYLLAPLQRPKDGLVTCTRCGVQRKPQLVYRVQQLGTLCRVCWEIWLGALA